MPFARLTIADETVSTAIQHRLAAEITALFETILIKDAEHTVVHVNPVSADRWFIAGEPLTDAVGAHLEVSITAGTNSASEKAAFLKAVDQTLRKSLDVPHTVYVALYELDGESYGFAGLSQLARRQSASQSRD